MEDIRVARRDRILRWIQLQGVVLLYDPVELEKLRSILHKIAPVLSEEKEILTERINAIYVYDMDEQPPETKESFCDAIAWRDVTTDDGDLYAIGISRQTLDAGEGYVALCFLHEMTHVETDEGDYSLTFHRRLNELLSRCRELTDIVVFNDCDAEGNYYDYTTGEAI